MTRQIKVAALTLAIGLAGCGTESATVAAPERGETVAAKKKLATGAIRLAYSSGGSEAVITHDGRWYLRLAPGVPDYPVVPWKSIEQFPGTTPLPFAVGDITDILVLTVHPSGQAIPSVATKDAIWWFVDDAELGGWKKSPPIPSP